MVTEIQEKSMYNFYIGLKDKDTLSQKFTVEEVAKLIHSVCKGFSVGFSLSTQMGGYLAKNGEYIVENSVKLCVTDITKTQAKHIAETLLKVLNQESVMVTVEKAHIYMLDKDSFQEK